MGKRWMVAAAGAMFAAGLAVPATAQDANQQLLKDKGCTACHANDKKLIGPAYKDVAKKYKGDAAAAGKLAEKVIKGGQGVWGPIPMPANRQVTDTEARALVAWILSLPD